MWKSAILVILLVSLIEIRTSQSINWYPLEDVTGEKPSPRSQHTAVYQSQKNEMIIFAGLYLYSSLSDTYSFNFDSNNWRKLETSGQVPPPIRKHTAVLNKDETEMLVYGGVDDNGNLIDSLYSLNLLTNEWSIIETKGDLPGGVIGHTAAALSGNRMLIFGGNSESAMLNDLYIYDIGNKHWTKMEPSGDIPVPRTSTIGSIIGNFFYIFGGIKYYGDIYGYLNDVYRYDIVNNAWEKVNAGGYKLDPRANYCAVTTPKNNYLILHGYWALYQDDVAYLDSKTGDWNNVDDGESILMPLGRSHATAISISNGDQFKVYMFGGNDGIYENNLGYKNDIWIAEGSGY